MRRAGCSRRRLERAFLGVFEHGHRLIASDVGKTVEVLFQVEAAFEIGEQAIHRHAGALKTGCPAKALRVNPDRHFRRIVECRARFHLAVKLAKSSCLSVVNSCKGSGDEQERELGSSVSACAGLTPSTGTWLRLPASILRAEGSSISKNIRHPNSPGASAAGIHQCREKERAEMPTIVGLILSRRTPNGTRSWRFIVKLPFDDQLSERPVVRPSDIFPRSTQIKLIGLMTSDDRVIWESAKQRGYAIVTKDWGFLGIECFAWAPATVN